MKSEVPTSTAGRSSKLPAVNAAGMREELRASLLKIHWLALKAARGEQAARALLVAAGIEPSLVEQETAWVSVETARRVLTAIAEELGEHALEEAASYVGHAEVLGPWVRMIREAKEPTDAYRWLAAHSQEQTRVGEWELEGNSEGKEGAAAASAPVRLVYRPRPDEPTEQDDVLCRVRATQLAGLATLWGLPPATVVHESCLAKGGDACRYAVTLQDVSTKGSRRTPLMAAATAAVGFAVVAPFSWVGAVLAALVAGALGYVLGVMQARAKRLERDRAFERTRIAALERGLELRGDSTVQAQGDLVGTVLAGKYRIGKRIGSGGIGVVHAAEHIGLGTQVAVKVLRGAAAKDGSEIARLRREAQVASALDHPNVVKVLDLDQLADGSIFVVMELLRGRSLAERLHRDGPLSPAMAVDVFRQVCLALAAAHDIGVVHRDLKPGNVFLCDDPPRGGEGGFQTLAKVLDFGMSKLGGATGGVGSEKLTQDGYTLGTPEYMAPEQCIGGTIEPRTDLYELGVLMYEALTGDLPIKSGNRRELLDLHQRQIPPPMRQRRPDLPIPVELDQAVATALRKRVADRPADARTFERMLAAVPLEGIPFVYPRNVGRSPPKRLGEEPHPTASAIKK